MTGKVQNNTKKKVKVTPNLPLWDDIRNAELALCPQTPPHQAAARQHFSLSGRSSTMKPFVVSLKTQVASQPSPRIAHWDL